VAGDTLLIVEDIGGLAGGEGLRIDDGAVTDYAALTATPFPALADRVVPVRSALADTYQAGVEVTPLTLIPSVGADAYAETLADAVDAGVTRIRVSALATGGGNPLARNNVLILSDPADPARDEFVIVESVPTGGDTTVTLRHRLGYGHAGTTTTVTRVVENAPGAAENAAQDAAAGAALLLTDATTALTSGDTVRLGGAPAADRQASYNTVVEFRASRMVPAAIRNHAVTEAVAVITLAPTGGAGAISNPLSFDAAAGTDRIRVNPRGPWAVGDWLAIDTGNANAEFAQIAELPTIAPDTDVIVLRQPLRFAHTVASAAAAVHQTRTAGTPQTILLQHLPLGATSLIIGDASNNFDPAANPGLFVEIGTGAEAEYHVLGPLLNPALLPLMTGLTSSHAPGTAIQLREELFRVHALDTGHWGDELRILIENEDPSVVQTTAAPAPANSDVTLASASGIEPGALLELIDLTSEVAAEATVGATAVLIANAAGFAQGDRIRIGRGLPEYAQIAAPPANNLLTLAQPLRRAHDVSEAVDRMDTATGLPRLAKVEQRVGSNQVAFAGGGLPFPITGDWIARSREFRLTVQWVKRGRANPRTPGEERVIDSETHRFLTLDDRHSRYVGRIIGSIDNPLRIWDRRPEGESGLIRVEDLATPDQTQTQIRPGPDLISEVLPTGRRRPFGRRLAGGNDDVGNINDDTYRGLDNIDPLLRTGLFSLRNQEEISLVSVPGRVSQFIQDALITHCELMRYRFAVLDSVPGTQPDGARLPEVQLQRQQFDSKYAALYYPWLRLRHPFPDNPAMPGDISIPPCGHVLGIYARTDVTRGVHKAPANEVIRGIGSLQRTLTKGEHDILNPYPMNINVLRDFREQRRGNRVWGARVITSDPDWKYVNVRRLFNYVERSLELGLQWVVFEPNDYDLWARVNRSISDFLTAVWRSGGLMGKTAEEAYFVRCDRTTMTQNDIDNGRLIVVIGIAPVKPAEFVIIRIGQWQGGSAVEEGLA
jgi:hypothetical protein